MKRKSMDDTSTGDDGMSVSAIPPGFEASSSAAIPIIADGTNGDTELNLKGRWDAMEKLLTRPSPFGGETGQIPTGMFNPYTNVEECMQDCRVLVIGAGGLGCEILKDLAMSAILEIVVIDMDTIDVSNLNRQFLFRQKDVGRPKATVAAEAIMSRVPGCTVEAHHAKIQDFDSEFYGQFHVVISGLDNIEARRWLNSMLCSLVEKNDQGQPDLSTIIPLVDGGTEGFKGQARVILPYVTSCFECSLGMFPPQRVFPMCTIAETPRMPEHCISYAMLLLWPKEFSGTKLDHDDPEHMQWVCRKAKERAEVHGIAGVTYELTLGVVKNIIPAVASTNAIIAAACTNEAIKLLSCAGQTMNNYMMYQGAEGIHGLTTVVSRKDDCLVCGLSEVTVDIDPVSPLALLPEKLNLQDASMTRPGLVLYMPNPPALRKQTEPNLKKPVGELCNDGDVLAVTAKCLHERSLLVTLRFT